MLGMPHTRRLLQPERPSGVWLYELYDDPRQLVAECGACGAWWYVQDDDDLDGVLTCLSCTLGGLDAKPPPEPKSRPSPTDAATPPARLDRTRPVWECECGHPLHRHGLRREPNSGKRYWSGCTVDGCSCEVGENWKYPLGAL